MNNRFYLGFYSQINIVQCTSDEMVLRLTMYGVKTMPYIYLQKNISKENKVLQMNMKVLRKNNVLFVNKNKNYKL